ncbi:MAG TPA: family 20 glycosylhydrolase [Candidatus Eisenbergiella pullistercoris]|uniref:Family 20 glycosylhydrolase n=1 Tax=Candidatus Eisenbergiella pullistercoris TaxID=2838555 RepID=A0A9D1YSM4_9FIRM|nr:family 20 glycosylhydrolase [Candidatus Eisenbergiella pullistercoris]
MKKKERKGKRDQGRKFWDRKLWKKGAAAAAAVLLLCAALAIFLSGDGRKEGGSVDMQEAESFPAGSASGKKMVNLALAEGVRVTADSTETEAFSPEKAADGNRSDSDSRWSSANEPGQPSHWLMFEFPEERRISFVRLYWERLNVEGFVLESSRNGTDWVTAARAEEAPEANEQCLTLDSPAAGRYFRIRTTAVSESEENQYLYYQNVSLLEAELYEEVPLSWSLQDIRVETEADGSRRLALPEVPEGVQIELAGADYEEVIGRDGMVYPTVEEKEVEVGFLLSRDGKTETTPGYPVTVPAAWEEDGVFAGKKTASASESGQPAEKEAADSLHPTDRQVSADSTRPQAVSGAAEWRAGSGSFLPGEEIRILADARWKEEAPQAVARLQEALGNRAEVVWSDEAESGPTDVRTEEAEAGSTGVPTEEAEAGSAGESAGDIRLGTASGELGLGKEGYLCEIERDGIVLLAEESQGLIWGVNTLCRLLEETGAETEDLGKENAAGQENAGQGHVAGGIPCGVIRDYPRCSVRGFSIDIGRRMVSMETLREMVLELSAHKMNTLGIHLNDNEILSTSGKNDSLENAFTAYSGFRLESSLQNEKGEGITSQDGAFTKEEWKEFVEWAAGFGVEVVPEIDTPAHSLALTKVFPEAALADEPENVDQLDLSRKETLSLTETLWKEYLEGEDPVFAEGGTVHIGMDEYYGDVQDYRDYMRKMVSLAAESGRPVRMWGSLRLIEEANRKEGRTGQNAYRLWEEGEEAAVSPEQIQIQIWSADWSDPLKTWQAGYTVINSLNSSLYLIPGGGYDYLDLEALADWEANEYPLGGRTELLPAWSSRTAGAIYCLWNDTIGSLDAGITEEGICDRFLQPLSLLSGKLW